MFSWCLSFIYLYIQHSIYICKFMVSFNAGGHCLVNLLVKMLFWLSVSLKQVARMYLSDLYRRNTVHYASLLLAVVHLPWKKNQVCPLFIWCNTMPVLSDVAFYTIHFSQWLKMFHLSYIGLADICWNWKRLMYIGYRIYPVVLLDLVSPYSQVIYFQRFIYIVLCNSIWYTVVETTY